MSKITKPTVFNYRDYLDLKERTRWVPCEEQLPQFPFLSCDTNGNIHIPMGIITFEDEKHGIWCVDDVHDEPELSNYENRIVAWMPLPPPYKEGD